MGRCVYVPRACTGGVDGPPLGPDPWWCAPEQGGSRAMAYVGGVLRALAAPRGRLSSRLRVHVVGLWGTQVIDMAPQ